MLQDCAGGSAAATPPTVCSGSASPAGSDPGQPSRQPEPSVAALPMPSAPTPSPKPPLQPSRPERSATTDAPTPREGLPQRTSTAAASDGKAPGASEKASALNWADALANFGGEETILWQLLHKFEERAKPTLRKIRKAARDNDLRVLRREACSLKGSAGYIAAYDLRRWAKSLEDMVAERAPPRHFARPSRPFPSWTQASLVWPTRIVHVADHIGVASLDAAGRGGAECR